MEPEYKNIIAVTLKKSLSEEQTQATLRDIRHNPEVLDVTKKDDSNAYLVTPKFNHAAKNLAYKLISKVDNVARASVIAVPELPLRS